MLERLSDFQAVHKNWKEAVTPTADFTPQNEVERATEEFAEILDASRTHQENPNPRTAKELGMEAIDVMVCMMGVISSLGYDAATLMEEKMDTIYHKYNPVKNQELRENGLGWQQALTEQKTQHNLNKNNTDNITRKPVFSRTDAIQRTPAPIYQGARS